MDRVNLLKPKELASKIVPSTQKEVRKKSVDPLSGTAYNVLIRILL